jgi:diguanylate cyclase (GGDEF)-like protein
VTRLASFRVLACWLLVSAVLPAQQYVFRAFRQAEGLKNLTVNAMATDRSGFLWLATENGVYRFLGSGFERYGVEQGIAELDISDVISDPNGAIWVATEGNLYRWDGQRFLPAGRDPISVEGPRHVVVEDARHLLVVQQGHLFRLEHDADGRMLSFLPLFPDRMLASMPDLARVHSLRIVNEPRNGLRVWAGCGKSLCSWPDGGAGNLAQPRDGMVTEWGKDKGIPEDYWQSVLLDRSGTLWAGSHTHVAAMPHGSARFVDRAIPGSAPESIIGHAPLIEDPEGRILAPAEEGIARWDGTGWRIIGKANGMESANSIVGLAFDAAGDLWFASSGKGLYQWAGYANWEGWGDQQNLPSDTIWAIAPYNADRIFVGTERGPAWVDTRNGSAGPLSDQRRWTFGQVSAMGANRDGSWWAATAHGAILRIDPKTGRTEVTAKLRLSASYLVSAFEDSSARLYLETGQGLFLLDPGVPGNRSSSLGSEAGFPRTAPHRIPAVDALVGASVPVTQGCESSGGAVWFLFGSSLLRLKDGQWTVPVIEGMSKQNGDMSALSCAADGTLWVVGSLGDTWRVASSGDRLRAWPLERPPELRSLSPLAILVDRRGWVWLGTDQGLLVWNGQSWRHLTQESGLIWNDTNQSALTSAPDGSLWIGTSGGLSHLLHPERVFDAIPLTVSLTELQRGETNYLGARQITLPWAGAPLQFRISSPTMRNRSELVLKVRMVGFQSEWMETHDGNATFARLPPGKYMFMAMACNPGLNACSDSVRVDIRVLPPWWRTIWFYGSCLLALFLLLLVASHLYDRQLRARSRQLEALVSERTRELEASREQLRIQATHDGLTGMLNRTAVLKTFVAERDRARRESRTVVVALIDLDHFKRINDTHGHLAGDDALRLFAAAVGAAIRPYDHAGRYGGEEFLLVLTEIPRELVELRLAGLHAAISNLQVSSHDAHFTLNCSMGATVYDPADQAGSVESLLAIADRALYAAKAEGRNRVVFRTPGHSGSQQEENRPIPNL